MNPVIETDNPFGPVEELSQTNTPIEEVRKNINVQLVNLESNNKKKNDDSSSEQSRIETERQQKIDIQAKKEE